MDESKVRDHHTSPCEKRKVLKSTIEVATCSAESFDEQLKLMTVEVENFKNDTSA